MKHFPAPIFSCVFDHTPRGSVFFRLSIPLESRLPAKFRGHEFAFCTTLFPFSDNLCFVCMYYEELCCMAT
jgi:hypothetical protein